MGDAGSGKITVTVDPDLEDLVAGYIANRQRDVQDIRAALAVADYETIRILGHSMKGSGGGYGFDRITEIGAEIEQAAKSNNAATLADLSEVLADYLERVNIVFG